jgi:hypothetical protein
LLGSDAGKGSGQRAGRQTNGLKCSHVSTVFRLVGQVVDLTGSLATERL